MILQQLFCETFSMLASHSQKMMIGEVVCRSGSVRLFAGLAQLFPS